MAMCVRVLVDSGDPDWRHALLGFLALHGFASTSGFLAHHGRPSGDDPHQLVGEIYGSVVDLAAELGIRVIDIAAGGRML